MDIGVSLPMENRVIAIRNPIFVSNIIQNGFFVGDYLILTSKEGFKLYAVLLYHSLN